MRTLINEGFFISPSGALIPVESSHIATVVSCPAAFGLTREEIDAAYAVHGEPGYIEGKAREEILRKVLKRGWIRLRRHRNRWSVQCDRLDEQRQAQVQAWAAQILRGLGRYIEKDRYINVVLEGLSDASCSRLTVGELARSSGAKQPLKLRYSTIEEFLDGQKGGAYGQK